MVSPCYIKTKFFHLILDKVIILRDYIIAD